MNNIYKIHKNTKNTFIYEIILQWYLIENKIRTIAWVWVPMDLLLTDVENFMKENKINYRIHIKSKRRNIFIYSNTFDIDNFNDLSTKKIGELLGDFYVCATNDFSKNTHRVVIIFNNVEIYAQMCNKKSIIENFEHFYKKFTQLKKLFKKLDPSIFGKIEFYE